MAVAGVNQTCVWQPLSDSRLAGVLIQKQVAYGSSVSIPERRRLFGTS